MRFWSLSSELAYAGAAPYALLLVVLAVPVTVVLFQQSSRAAAL
jgi:iron(III) transport system permease protein